jgi:short-subunit dehydrogenase
MDSYQYVAAITGAASGLGLAIAKQLAKNQFNLVLIDINQTRLQTVSKELSKITRGRILPIEGDVSSIEFMTQLPARIEAIFPHINYFFNNAGIIGETQPIWQTDIKDWERVLSVNVNAVLNMAKVFIPHFIEKKVHTHIINMGSIFSLINARYLGLYAASKHALLSISESLYLDLYAKNIKNITVSVALPSFMNTNLLENSEIFNRLLSYATSADEIATRIIQALPTKQFYIIPDDLLYVHVDEYILGIRKNIKPIHDSIDNFLSKIEKIA